MAVDLSGGLANDLGLVWATQPENPEMRESVNAWIWDDGIQVGMPRIGVEAVADQWDTHDIQVNIALADGRVYNVFGNGPIHDPTSADGQPRVLGAGPLSFDMVETYGRWVMSLDAMAAATSAVAQIGGALPGQGEPVPVQAEIELVGAAPPWMNGSLDPEALRVLEQQEEGDLMGHPWRFEQLCRTAGTLRIGDQEFRITGAGNRIRRQGIRRVAKLWGHAWQAALFPSGRGFGYIAYPPRKDGKPTLNEGYVFLGAGKLVPARVVDPPWLSSLAPAGQDVSFGLQTAQGTFEITGETVASTFMVMPPEIAGGLELQQCVARYIWDGEAAPGMIERSIALADLS